MGRPRIQEHLSRSTCSEAKQRSVEQQRGKAREFSERLVMRHTAWESEKRKAKGQPRSKADSSHVSFISCPLRGDRFHCSHDSIMSYVSNFLSGLESSFCIDKSRVYAAGFSNGGGLTGLLACHPLLSSRIAAFSAASGAFYKDSALPQPLFQSCSPSRKPIPFLEFHGTEDTVIDYEGVGTPKGKTFEIPEFTTAWAERNGCQMVHGNASMRLNGGNVLRYMYFCDMVSFRCEFGGALQAYWRRAHMAPTGDGRSHP
jgi:hypothetical protein